MTTINEPDRDLITGNVHDLAETNDEKMDDASESTAVIPRGRPKSGRSWKTVEQRSSAKITSKAVRTKWAVRKEQRKDDKEKRDIVLEIKKEQEEERQKEREKRKNNKRRREENIIKSSTYQVVTDTSKIKRMSKKQRRLVMKLADLPQH